MFELSVTPKLVQHTVFVAAAIDDRVIDIPLCNATTWHSMLLGQGLIRYDAGHLCNIASSCCDMVNIKWSVIAERDDESVDTIEAVMLTSKGVYASLIGTLVIILHSHTAELQCITAEHVRLGSYRHLSIIICRSLYQDSQSEEAISSVAVCAPAIVAMDPNGPWSPIPVQAQKQVNKMSPEYDVGMYNEKFDE